MIFLRHRVLLVVRSLAVRSTRIARPRSSITNTAAVSKRVADDEFMAMLHGSDSEDDAPDVGAVVQQYAHAASGAVAPMSPKSPAGLAGSAGQQEADLRKQLERERLEAATDRIELSAMVQVVDSDTEAAIDPPPPVVVAAAAEPPTVAELQSRLVQLSTRDTRLGQLVDDQHQLMMSVDGQHQVGADAARTRLPPLVAHPAPAPVRSRLLACGPWYGVRVGWLP